MKSIIPRVAIFALLSAICFASSPCFDKPSLEGDICAENGRLPSPRPYPVYEQHHIADSAEECFFVCLNFNFYEGCASIGYDPATKACHIFEKSLSEQGFFETNSRVIYYDSGCFTCLDTCPIPVGVNLLTNGGFDQFPDKLDPWSLREFKPKAKKYAGVVQGGFNSPQSFQEVYAKGEPDTLTQTFYRCAVKNSYAVTLDYKFTFTEGVGISSIGFVVEDLNVRFVANAAKGGIWQPLTVLYHTYLGEAGPPTTDLNILPRVGKGATIQIDNVVVKRIQAKPSSNPSIISNGGFEHGLAPWMDENNTKYHTCGLVKPGFKSSTAFKCSVGRSTDTTLRQVIATKPNTPYILSFDYKAIGRPENNGCYIHYVFGDSSYLGPGYEHENIGRIKNDTWLHLSEPVMATGASTLLMLVFGEFYSNPHIRCNLFVDNISLVEATI